MNMYVRHHREIHDELHLNIAYCQVPLYGRWIDLSISAYHLRESGTCINFAVVPTSDLRSDDTFAARRDGMLVMERGSGGHRQTFQQELVAPYLLGQFLAWSDLRDGGVDAGRALSAAMLRKAESIVETVRVSIRNHLSGEVSAQALRILNERYGKSTEKVVNAFLGQVNWKLLLDGAGCDDDCLNVVDYTLSNQPVTSFDVNFDGETTIPLVAHSEVGRWDRTTLANIKATALLKNVCGTVLGDEFDATGAITMVERDYKFRIRPGQFVDCEDPNGKTARLCIHTIGLSVNPIDELVIAFLHIKHRFDAYMRMAIYHGAQPGFVKPEALLSQK